MITDELAARIRQAVLAARDCGDLELNSLDFDVRLETPPGKQFGDYSSNVALALKRQTGMSDSREIAAIIVRHLPSDDSLLERADVAGPGFLNLYLRPAWLHNTLLTIHRQGASYGASADHAGERILLEFVSANPTGPISVVNGRAAVLGDVMANLFASQGAEVSREFYVNDALNSLQLDRFAVSVMVRYLQQLGHPVRMPDGALEPASVAAGEPKDAVAFPPDGYLGEYVKDIARDLAAQVGQEYHDEVLKSLGPAPDEAPVSEACLLFFRRATLQQMVATQERALAALGIRYDRWYFESELYESGAVDQAIEHLKEKGHTYVRDGATWLRSTEFGDDEDRVLVRSNEKATYVAADAAYHADKFARGYTRLIDILGADHHGYVARLRAGVAALGLDVKRLDIVLTQMIALVRDGEPVTGGKRKGAVIELKEDLIDDIGRDAGRFYFLLNSYETPASIDVELAKRQSNENPVYYVQYAHARLCNILRKAEEMNLGVGEGGQHELALLTHDQELAVIRKLHDYPADVRTASDRFAPHRLTRFAMDLASLLNLFYENCRVLPGRDTEVAASLVAARLFLVDASRIVLANLLGLLGVTAPTTMTRSGDQAAS